MSLRLIDRITLLVKADAHGVVEALEERSLLLKQCVREAEIELNQKAARLDAVREEEKRLSDTLARIEQEVRAADEDIGLAVSGGKDDLARFAIRRLIARRRDATALHRQLEERSAEAQALAERLATQQAQLDSLRVRVRAELSRPRAGDAVPAWFGETTVADEEVELELMRRRQSERGRP
jgi:phage shock protein A